MNETTGGGVRFADAAWRPGVWPTPDRLLDWVEITHRVRSTMMDARQLEELAAKLAAVIPPGLRGLRAELQDNFRAVLAANLERLDLVSRERFDVQAELLRRTQHKLTDIDTRLRALEQRLNERSGS